MNRKKSVLFITDVDASLSLAWEYFRVAQNHYLMNFHSQSAPWEYTPFDHFVLLLCTFF